MSDMNPDEPKPQIQRVSREYFEAEFGPIDGPREHTAHIAPQAPGKTPAFMVWPHLAFDDGADVPLNLRPFDPGPEAA